MRRATDRPSAGALVVVSTLVLGGCANSLTRADDLWPFSGDAVAANRIAQTIDPWPRASARTSFPTNGARMAESIVRYKTNKGAEPMAPPVLVTR